jgi:hypothetical protein
MPRVVCSFVKWGHEFRIVVRTNSVYVERSLNDSMGNKAWVTVNKQDFDVITILMEAVLKLSESEQQLLDKCKSCGVNTVSTNKYLS